MLDIIRQVEFREFSYEDDAESLVDLHRCMEILEGGWFDGAVTCRMHAKIVARTPGSSWVVALGSSIFGHADLLGTGDGTGTVVRWRLHPDLRHPLLARKLLVGLAGEAGKRAWNALILVGDTAEVCGDLESAGLCRDRTYRWLLLEDADPGPAAVITPFEAPLQDFSPTPLLRYLGAPHPPGFVVHRAIMAADYGVFGFIRPRLFNLSWQGNDYLACFDGREWYVFRKTPHDLDLEAVAPVLRALAAIGSGRLLANDKAQEASGMVPTNDATLSDFYHPL